MAAKPRHSPQDGIIHPALLFAARLLLIAAAGLAIYLLWVSLSRGAVAGCGPDSPCDRVLHSRWSRWVGVPVSAIALPVYVALFAGTFQLRRGVPAPRQRAAWRWLVPGLLAVVGAAVWFALVQGVILRSFCRFCMAAHGCGLAASLALLWCVPFRIAPAKPWQQEKQVFVPPELGRKLALLSLGAVGLLVAGQFVRLPHKQYIVKIFDGKLQVNLSEAPVIGSPKAPYSIISLFDYTCSHCRIMHTHLMEAHRQFGDRLAIVSLPMPLCEKCNHTVKRSPKEHAQACEYARVGLALWRAKPKAQPQFDDWVFTPETPPPLVATRQYASQLAGPAAFERALKDPWIEEQIQRDISIYETNGLRGLGNMPQLIIGTNVASGTFSRAEDLFQLLSQNLGLKRGI